MHSITEHCDPPYIEISVSDRYNENYRDDVEAVICRYAALYEEFCILEVQHSRISNGLWRLMQTGGRLSAEMLAAFKKLRRFAIVGNDPDLITKLFGKLPRLGSAEMRLFKLHEYDDARAWMRI